MTYYYIRGFDQWYQGMHGMMYDAIDEFDSLKEAEDYARELAIEVISDFATIRDHLEDDVSFECEAKGIEYKGPRYSDEEEDAIRGEIYEEDLCYSATPLDMDKLPTMDLKELNELLINVGSDEFVVKYVKENA